MYMFKGFIRIFFHEKKFKNSAYLFVALVATILSYLLSYTKSSSLHFMIQKVGKGSKHFACFFSKAPVSNNTTSEERKKKTLLRD